MDALDLRVLALALPLTIGIVELLKGAGLPARWAGVAALLVGAAAAVAVRLAGVGDGSLALAALTGVVAGLSAAGVRSGTKAATRAGSDGRQCY
jgi:hypothetical protein